jgi:uncharacterized protein YhbP (UPF0306 family)
MEGDQKGGINALARAVAGQTDGHEDSLPSPAWLLALVLGTLVVSIAIPIVLDIFVAKKLSGIEQFLLGASIYAALTLTAQAYHLRRLDARTTRERRLWRVNNDFDRRLSNIRESFASIVESRRTGKDFYSLYFERALELFEETIGEAASNRELLVDENHLSTTDMLLSSFSGLDSDVARFVHYFEDNEWMFETWAKNYCVRVWRLVQLRKLKEVRRLFIYRDPDEQTSDRSKRLMEFHGANEHYDYRVLSEATYKNIVRDFHMRERFKDFGIYGDWCVYRTLAASPEHIEGVFSASERKVRVYQSLFERCWDDAQEPPPNARTAMTPAELFGEQDRPVSVGPEDHPGSGLGDDGPRSSASPHGANEPVGDVSPDGKISESEQAENRGGTMVEITSVTGGVSAEAARKSLRDILSGTPLCTIATRDEDGDPSASTAFYALDQDEMILHVLTGPDTEHGRNILANGRAALTVYSTEQTWTDAKRGVQMKASAGLTSQGNVEDALQRYLAAYPGLSKWVRRAEEIEANLDNRFFSFVVEKCKVFDEPSFGSEVWIEVDFAQRANPPIAIASN